MHSAPEPRPVRSPSPAMARVKMVGNIIELHSPTARMVAIAVGPPKAIVAATSENAVAAHPASTTPGDLRRKIDAPAKRPIIAPPQ